MTDVATKRRPYPPLHQYHIFDHIHSAGIEPCFVWVLPERFPYFVCGFWPPGFVGAYSAESFHLFRRDGR